MRDEQEHDERLRDEKKAHVSAGSRGRMPAAWSKAVAEDSGEYEWIPLRLPPDVTRVNASIRLSIEAEYRGWELTRVRLYTDGSRRVLLRRRKRSDAPPGPDQPAL